jgi:hypothetical protein
MLLLLSLAANHPQLTTTHAITGYRHNPTKALKEDAWGYSIGFSCKQFSKLNNDYARFLTAMLEDSEDAQPHYCHHVITRHTARLTYVCVFTQWLMCV